MNITFKKESDYHERYSASWTDATGRYHLWIVDGKIDPVICKNPLQRPDGSFLSYRDVGYFSTRKLNLKAKANRAVDIAISTAIRHGALERAAVERQAEIDAAQAAEVAKLVADRRAQLIKIAAATDVFALAHYVRDASDEAIVALPGDCF